MKFHIHSSYPYINLSLLWIPFLYSYTLLLFPIPCFDTKWPTGRECFYYIVLILTRNEKRWFLLLYKDLLLFILHNLKKSIIRLNDVRKAWRICFRHFWLCLDLDSTWLYLITRNVFKQKHTRTPLLNV